MILTAKSPESAFLLVDWFCSHFARSVYVHVQPRTFGCTFVFDLEPERQQRRCTLVACKCPIHSSNALKSSLYNVWRSLTEPPPPSVVSLFDSRKKYSHTRGNSCLHCSPLKRPAHTSFVANPFAATRRDQIYLNNPHRGCLRETNHKSRALVVRKTRKTFTKRAFHPVRFAIRFPCIPSSFRTKVVATCSGTLSFWTSFSQFRQGQTSAKTLVVFCPKGKKLFAVVCNFFWVSFFWTWLLFWQRVCSQSWVCVLRACWRLVGLWERRGIWVLEDTKHVKKAHLWANGPHTTDILHAMQSNIFQAHMFQQPHQPITFQMVIFSRSSRVSDSLKAKG